VKVSERVAAILGLPVGTTIDEIAELTHEGSGLTVRLRGKGQRLLGERVLPPDEDCGALEQAAAVVLATWLTDAHPEFVARLPEKPDEPAEAPPAAASARPPPVFEARVRSTGRLRAATRVSGRYGLALGAGFGASQVVPALALSAAILPNGSGVGAFARTLLSTPRTLSVESGEARYFRFPFGAGVALRLDERPLAAELHVGPAIGWFNVKGSGFVPNHTENDVTFAFMGALRGGLPLGMIEPFAELVGLGWLKSARIVVDDPNGGRNLSPLEAAALAGVTFRP
jgi:hypothetical protein